MTYAIGDQVEGYLLTEQGWVPRLELDTSPFRPGHVVDGAILTGELEWQPLRTAPSAPYRVGDVVEGYVLVPSGDWQPLAGQVRDRSGAARQATAVPVDPPAKTQHAKVRTTQTQAQVQARTQTHRSRTSTSDAQPQPRPAQPRPAQPRPAQPRYQVGQVVNGHVLTADRGWVPLPHRRGPAPRPAGGPATKNKNDAIGRALFGAVAVIVLILLRSCG